MKYMLLIHQGTSRRISKAFFEELQRKFL